MNKNKVVKGLLGVSVAAALFAALAANAQTAGQSSNPSGTATSGQSTSGSSQMGTSQGTKGTASGTGTGQDTKGSASGTSTGQDTKGSASGTSTGQDTKGTASGTSTGAAASLSKSDQKALMDMARANMAEQMIDDHTKALGDVQQVAQAKGVTLPTELDAKHKAMAAKLDKMSGAAFDKAYMAQAGVADHKTVHKMLQKDQKSAKDPDVKALAEKMLPTVEQHLKSAQQIAAAKGGTKAGK
jgi:putative membrane protein